MSIGLAPGAIGFALAFAAGSIPFGLIIARSRGVNIREHGSGNIGATNVGRVLGRPYFFLCFALDMLKGLLPTLGFGLWTGLIGADTLGPVDLWVWLGVMVAPVFGHMFSPFVGFKGGKGVATGLGTLLGFFPLLTIAGALALGVFLLVLKTWKYVSLASCSAAMSLPVTVAGVLLSGSMGGLGSGWPVLVVAFVLALLVTLKHKSNISRIRAGTEPKVGAPKPASVETDAQ